MHIEYAIRNGIAWVTLNRPDALNALTLPMVTELQASLERYAADSNIRAVLIRGAGRAFCAGGDVRALYESYQSGGTLHEEFFRVEYALDYFLHRYPKPYLALLDGIVMGGGMGLAQGARLRLVGERTRMAMPEVSIGFFPDVGASYFLANAPGQIGTYLGLTGVSLRAADALYARLADWYLPPAAIEALPATLDTVFWRGDDPAGWFADLLLVLEPRAADAGPAPLEALRPAIDEHFAAADVPTLLASLRAEQRAPYAAWAQQTAELLTTRSPTMLAVTLRQLVRGRTLKLAECFRFELGIAQRSLQQGDFIEGVRAIIIDKDRAPVWQPASSAAIRSADIEALLSDPWAGQTHPLAALGREAADAD